jgi:hypothetical protein
MNMIWIFALMILQSNPALAAGTCAHCSDVQKLEAELATVTPDPLDPATAKKQDDLIFQGSVLAGKILAATALDEESALAVAGLLTKLLAYDNAMISVADNLKDVQRHYRSGELERALAKLEREKKISAQEKADFIESYGIKGAL